MHVSMHALPLVSAVLLSILNDNKSNQIIKKTIKRFQQQ